MSLILGILAQSGGAAVAASSYESIQTVTVGSGGSASVSFTSIPATYKHLQIRAMARTTSATIYGYLTLRFNSDSTTSNYVALHQIYGFGATAAAQSATSGYGYVDQSYLSGASSGASMFGAFVTDILDYTSTTKNKTTRTIAGTDQNGSGAITFGSGLWMNSSTAINTIVLTDAGGGNLAQYSSFALYGIKG